MIEPIMYFGIGFLVAALIGLVIVPLVHGRAVRLTMRRLEAATPLSMAEIQADKDQLRAEFAMSTRRLEMSVEQLKAKTTSQFAELGKKGDAINRLKMELGEKTAAIFALEARDKALRDQLRATEEEVAAKTGIMHEAERTLSDKEAELAKLVGALDERSTLADSQKVEIDHAQDPGRDAERTARRRQRRTQGRGRPPRRRAGRAQSRDAGIWPKSARGSKISAAASPSSSSNWRRRPRRPNCSASRAQDLETRLGEQVAAARAKRIRTQPAAQRDCSPRARPKTTCAPPSPSCDEPHQPPRSRQLKTEKAQLQSDLSRTTDERDRLARDLGSMKREAEENWAAERVENALLRERINDVAAEVARLASALEGPNSPIDAILAAETARDRASDRSAGRRTRRARRQTAISPTASARCRAMPRACRTATSRRAAISSRPASLDTSSSALLISPGRHGRALSSAGERSLHTGEVVGSIPTAPTIRRGCRPRYNFSPLLSQCMTILSSV